MGLVQWSVIYAGIISALWFLLLDMQSPWAMLWVPPFVRWFTLDTVYNKKAGNDFWYLSSNGLDGWIRKVSCGKMVQAYRIKAGIMILSILSYYIVNF